MSQMRYLRKDLIRWKVLKPSDYFYIIFEEGLWATIFYRIARFLFLVKIPVIRLVFRLVAFFLFKFSELFLGVAIRPGTDIGPGLYIGHTGVIRIHPNCRVGKNLSIGQLVTIGTKGLGDNGVPMIGDDVYIGSGAKVLGGIVIGNNVRIGANAVVISDIPHNCTAVGVPAIIKRR